MTIEKNGLSGQRILLIDDDTGLLELLHLAFARAGCTVYTTTDGLQGLRHIFDYRPGLIILEIMLPCMDGWEICRINHQLAQIPIIMLTRLGEKEHIIRGLKEGADDYLVKPFDIEILLAKAQAILRRETFTLNNPLTYNDGYLMIDLEKQQVLVSGQPVDLTKTERKLLTYLVHHAGQLLSYQRILDNIWGWEEGHAGVIHTHISRLRQKIERDAKQPSYLLTEHGLGYRFQKQNLK